MEKIPDFLEPIKGINQPKERFFPVILLIFRHKRDQDARIARLYVKFRSQRAEKFALH